MQGHFRARLGSAALGATVLSVTVVSVTALAVAGCSVAPAGADLDSPAIGPTAARSAGNFGPFPVPSTYQGLGDATYETLQAAVTGTVPRNIHLDAQPELVFWLACLGTGTARLSSADLGLKWSVPCGSGSAADPQAINFQPTTGIAAGTPVKVLVSVTPGARWEVRIDIPAPSGTSSASPGTPSASPGTPSASPGAVSPAPGQTP